MIYLTGASGYLGQHIVRLGGDDVVPVPRDRYDMVKGQCVIHAGWPTPKTDAEARSVERHLEAALYAETLARCRPRFVVLVSTRAEGTAYRFFKNIAGGRLTQYGVPHRIVRFPGLYGPPRRSGLMYHATRAMLTGQSFTPEKPLPDWTGMRVEKAAQICLDLARAETPGLTIARDEEFEEWLRFCRS